LGYLGLLKRLFQTFQYPAFINKYIFWLILELLGTDGRDTPALVWIKSHGVWGNHGMGVFKYAPTK